MSIWISETFVNKDTNTRFSETEPYESRFDNYGDLYRFCVREWGRCTGKVHTDTKDSTILDVGWIFIKRDVYSDRRGDTYNREVWVTIHDPNTLSCCSMKKPYPARLDETQECRECGSLGSQACAPDCKTQRQPDDGE